VRARAPAHRAVSVAGRLSERDLKKYSTGAVRISLSRARALSLSLSLSLSLARSLSFSLLYGSLSLSPAATAKEERGARGVALGTRGDGGLW
jgi:hypothetical protein